MSKTRPTLKDKEASTQESLNLNDYSDMTALDPALKSEIEGKGLVYRWINAHKLQSNFGFDPRQWAPYKREGAQKTAFSQTDSEGYVRRGDLILAVQSAETFNRRRSIVKRKNELNKNHLKSQAADLRKGFSDAGLRARVTEGYEENE